MSEDFLKLALAEVGVKEWKDGHNPEILGYFKDAGFSSIKDDETAWCAAFVGAILKRTGRRPTGSLLARSYLKYGTEVSYEEAQPGDLVILPRGNSTWQGHVTILVKKRGLFMDCVGGNQKNSVNITSYNSKGALGFRRIPSIETQKKQANVRRGIAGAVAAAGAGGAYAYWDSLQQFLATLF